MSDNKPKLMYQNEDGIRFKIASKSDRFYVARFCPVTGWEVVQCNTWDSGQKPLRIKCDPSPDLTAQLTAWLLSGEEWINGVMAGQYFIDDPPVFDPAIIDDERPMEITVLKELTDEILVDLHYANDPAGRNRHSNRSRKNKRKRKRSPSAKGH